MWERNASSYLLSSQVFRVRASDDAATKLVCPWLISHTRLPTAARDPGAPAMTILTLA